EQTGRANQPALLSLPRGRLLLVLRLNLPGLLIVRGSGLHRDLLGLGFGLLGQRDRQDAVGALRVNRVRVDGCGQREAAHEAAIAALNPMEVLFLLLRLELALA